MGMFEDKEVEGEEHCRFLGSHCNRLRKCVLFQIVVHITRSLLFYGPYHQYPIRIEVGFRLLREIDALTQRFYTFPIQILSLV